MNDVTKYVFGGFPVTSVNILRLISELEVHINLPVYGFQRRYGHSRRDQKEVLQDVLQTIKGRKQGELNQLVERLLCKQDIISSSPLFSTPCEGIAKKGVSDPPFLSL